MWTCKELTPQLCDLEVTTGSLDVRGVTVTYWMYHHNTPPAASSNSEYDDMPTMNLHPIIAIHGGPGWPHNYMLPLQQQACRGRDVYFYDQAGCGLSQVPDANATIREKYPWLLTIEYYAHEELPAIVSHLGLTEFHIIGSSWGTVLSQYYALNMKNHGLASMVLSGPLSDADLYIQSQWDDQDGSIGSLPPFVQERIRILEADKAYESEEYQQIDAILTNKFTCRTAPLPDCFLESEKHFNKEIYVGMQGASEFTIAGVLGDLNITHRLSELEDLPILLTHGQYDTMRPAVVHTMYDAIPLAEKYLLKKSGHVSMIDEPLEMNNAIADFLNRVEAARSSEARFSPRIEWKSKREKMQTWTLIIAVLVVFVASLVFGRRQSSSSRGQYSTV